MSCKVCDELVRVIATLREDLANTAETVADYKIDVENLRKRLKEQEKGFEEAGEAFRAERNQLKAEEVSRPSSKEREPYVSQAWCSLGLLHGRSDD